MTQSSFRTSLRAFSVLGGGQIISTLSNVIKMKVTAAILGPTGVGLIGIFASLIQTAALVASLGVGSGATRQVSAAVGSGNDDAVTNVRRAIFWLSLILAIAGAVTFLLLSTPISRLVLGSDLHATEVAWLSIGVGLLVVAASQSATLAGLRRVGDLARIDVATGVIGAFLGILAVLLLREKAPVIVVLTAPVVTVIVGFICLARAGRVKVMATRLSRLSEEVKPILRIGVYAVYWGVLFQAGFLTVRALIQHELGYEASGLYQAAWAIGLAYQGFVVSSTASDFFPRLTGVINDRSAANKLINEQTEIGLLICLPLGLSVLAFAPWVIRLLYTPEFLAAVDVLRWQVLGDVLKMAYYPLGYALIALGSARTFAINQTIGVAAFVLTSFIGIQTSGLAAVGFAYVVMWAFYLPIPWLIVRRKTGLKWARPVLFQISLAIVTAGSVAAAGAYSDPLGALVGGILVICTGFWALIRISDVVGAGGPLGKLGLLGERIRTRLHRD